MKYSWSLGDLVESRIYVRKDGAFANAFSITKVEVCNPSDTVISTITSPFLITNPSTGIYSVTYQTDTSSTVGTWTMKWYLKYTGYETTDTVIESNFTLKSGTYEASDNAEYPLAFTYALLNDVFPKESQLFLRINVDEIYDRLWSINNAKIRIQQYKNKYEILTTQDWIDASWVNQEMIVIFDCSSVAEGDNYFAQVKLDLSNGETALSPKLKIRVVDFVNQNAW
jgi:hypothetical protein